jgi:sugar phosphate isomerase/epimerase
MKLSFSTLGCPQWSFEQILENGRQYGFDAVAFRGVLAQLDLTKVPEFAPAERAHSRARLRAAGLEPSMLLTSTRLMVANKDELEAGLRSAEAHIDLAADLGAPSIRVFGGPLEVGLSRAEAVRRAAERLRRLGDHAATRDIVVLLETHDDFTDPALVRRIMEATAHPAVGVLWDIHHPFRMLEVPLDAAWREVGPWVKSCDIKDSVTDISARLGYRYVELGSGELPLDEALTLLRSVGYDGALTFEWEKLWHPELAEPEQSFPAFIRVMREKLAKPSNRSRIP